MLSRPAGATAVYRRTLHRPRKRRSAHGPAVNYPIAKPAAGADRHARWQGEYHPKEVRCANKVERKACSIGRQTY
jgi:hypothetical protein